MKVRFIAAAAALLVSSSASQASAGLFHLCVGRPDSQLKTVTVEQARNVIRGADLIVSDVTITHKDCNPTTQMWDASTPVGTLHCEASDMMRGPHCDKTGDPPTPSATAANAQVSQPKK